MAYVPFNVTLTGAAQQLVVPSALQNLSYYMVQLEVDSANNIVYLGKDNTVSAANYNGTIQPGDVRVIDGSGTTFHGTDVWLLGTAEEILHVIAIEC